MYRVLVDTYSFNHTVLIASFVGGSSTNIGLAGFHVENFIRGGSSFIIMKGGHDQMKGRCGFYSKLECCEGVFEELEGGKLPPYPPQ